MTVSIQIDSKELVTNLNKAADVMDGKSRVQMLREGAAVIQAGARANIALKLNKNSRGALSRGVLVKGVNAYAVDVGVYGIIYARIHEFGGVITPKRARFLHFFIDGKEIFTKYVVIPARPYFWPAVESGKRGAFEAMGEYLKGKFKELF